MIVQIYANCKKNRAHALKVAMAPMLSIAVSQPTQLRCWEVLGGCEVRVRILAGIRLPQDLASDLAKISVISVISSSYLGHSFAVRSALSEQNGSVAENAAQEKSAMD